jgi:hypothetical protein
VGRRRIIAAQSLGKRALSRLARIDEDQHVRIARDPGQVLLERGGKRRRGNDQHEQTRDEAHREPNMVFHDCDLSLWNFPIV